MSSRFITETELEEKRKVRQEEWERVRKPEDPTEAPLPPEQLPDRRSLYERLQEQKSKKQEEFEESRKLKNLVKGLDDDEAEYLEDVDKARVNEERRKRMEEARELSEFRSKVAEMREKDIDTIIKQEIGLIKTDKKTTAVATETLPSIGVSKTSQSQRLAGLVKRKSSGGGNNEPGPSDVSSDAVTIETETKRVKLDSETPKVLNVAAAAPAKGTKESSSSGSASSLGISDSGSIDEIPSVPYKGSLVCIGVLPGLASYDESSDSCEDDDSSSDSDNRSPAQPLRDLVGRTIGHQEGKDSAKDKEKKS